MIQELQQAFSILQRGRPRVLRVRHGDLFRARRLIRFAAVTSQQPAIVTNAVHERFEHRESARVRRSSLRLQLTVAV